MDLPRYSIREIPVNPLPADEVDGLITGWLRRGDRYRQVVTLNAVMLSLALRDQRLSQVLQQADLVTVDGYGILWALRRMGYPVKRQYPGVQLTRNLLAWSSDAACPVFFYGGTAYVISIFKRALTTQWPNLIACGVRQGFGGTGPRSAAAREIVHAQPGLLLVGLGSPDQELFLAEILPKLNGTVGIGVGGSFEILAGCRREAPSLFRDHGLEWLYRMMQDPRKLRRIPELLRFWGMVMRETRGNR